MLQIFVLLLIAKHIKMEATTKQQWIADTAHSEVQFKVKHLVISTVTGNFGKFSATVAADNDTFEGAQVEVNIDANSITTNNEDRDNHLKSDDFFGTETYPSIQLKNGVISLEGGSYKLKGDMQIKDVTKPIVLDVDFNGVAKDPWGNTKAGFEFSGKINRKDYGLVWNATTEAGGLLVGEDVKIIGSIQLAVS